VEGGFVGSPQPKHRMPENANSLDPAAAHREIQRLGRLLEVARQDQELLSFELHDGIVQQMTAALMHLQAVLADLTAADPLQPAISQAAELLQSAIHDTRRLITNLQPVDLETLGLNGALRQLALQHAASLRVEINSDPAVDQLEGNLLRSLYRVVQEAVNNAARHSGAESCAVRIWLTPDQVHAEIQDSGCGFDSRRPSGRFGLKGIRHRAATLGGLASVDSAPGKGTRIAVALPR
jgi:two-component system sensor histidine kinase UhpB